MSDSMSRQTASSRPAVVLTLSILLLAAPSGAQAPEPAGRGAPPGGGPLVPPVVSPEVLPDRRVIVRLYAPQAREVSINFEQGGRSMTKSESGVWEATLGPLDPGSYRYGFAVDGTSIADPRNIEVERMQVVTRSILHVPGAAFMDTRDVPHGTVGVVTYFSKALGTFRRFHVYHTALLAVLDDPKLKNGLTTLWFSTGTDDFLIDNSRATVAMLKRHGFAVTFQESTGAHTWVNRRNYLHEFAPRLFR